MAAMCSLQAVAVVYKFDLTCTPNVTWCTQKNESSLTPRLGCDHSMQITVYMVVRDVWAASCPLAAGRPNWRHAAPWCPKYDTNHSTQPTIYERMGGAHARNILELRAWKAQRALELCQVAPCPLHTSHLRWHHPTRPLTTAFSAEFKGTAWAPVEPADCQSSPFA